MFFRMVVEYGPRSWVYNAGFFIQTCLLKMKNALGLWGIVNLRNALYQRKYQIIMDTWNPFYNGAA